MSQAATASSGVVPPPLPSVLPLEVEEALRSLTLLYQRPPLEAYSSSGEGVRVTGSPSVSLLVTSDLESPPTEDIHGTTDNQSCGVSSSDALLAGGLLDMATCVSCDARETCESFQEKLESRIAWLSGTSRCLESMKEKLAEVEQQLIDMEARSRDALDQTEALNVVYADSAEKEYRIRNFIKLVKQRTDYFDRIDDVRREVGDDRKSFIATLLTTDYKRSTSEAVDNSARPKSAEAAEERLSSLFCCIDDAIAFFDVHKDFAEGPEFAAQYNTLRLELLLAGRQVVQQTLDNCETHAQRQRHVRTQGEARSMTRPSLERLPPSMHYNSLHERFRTAGRYVKPLIMALQRRAGVNADMSYNETLNLLEGIYASTRLRLISDAVRDHLVSVQRKYRVGEGIARSDRAIGGAKCQDDQHDLLGNTGLSLAIREAVSFCVLVAELEYQTLASVFSTDGQGESSALTSILRVIGDTFVQVFRPLILQSTLLTELRAVADALTMDFWDTAEDSGAHRMEGGELASLYSAILRLHKDVEERMIFKAESYIGTAIRGFEPGAEDLQYPAVLFMNRKVPSFGFMLPSHNSVLPSSSSLMRSSEEPSGVSTAGAEECVDEAASQSGESSQRITYLYTDDGWYPSLRHLITCLSTVEGVIRPAAFESLCQRATEGCLASLLDAAERMKRLKGSICDADLFLIKHLLMLREQAIGFQCNLVATENVVDFSAVKSRIKAFLGFGSSALSPAQPQRSGTGSREYNGTQLRSGHAGGVTFGGILGTLLPSIQETRIDTQHDLEVALKKSCEALIAHFAAFLLFPLLRLSSACMEAERFHRNSRKMSDASGLDGCPEEKKQLHGVQLRTVRDHVAVFRRALIVFVPRIMFHLTIYLGPMLISEGDVLSVPLLEFPCDERDDGTGRLEQRLPSEPRSPGPSPALGRVNTVQRMRTSVSMQSPSAPSILSTVLKDAIVEAVRHLERVLVEFQYFLADEPPDAATAPGSSYQRLSIETLRREFQWWSDHEIAARWDWLAMDYEHCLMCTASRRVTSRVIAEDDGDV